MKIQLRKGTFTKMLCDLIYMKYKTGKINWASVSHAYNPSYTVGRDEEDYSSNPAWANSSQAPISKKSSQKRAGGVAQGVGPEFKSQYHKKRENMKRGSENSSTALNIPDTSNSISPKTKPKSIFS
jgi:hypothetical protein